MNWTACSLHGARMKSSSPSAGSTPKGKTSCAGISGSTAVLDPDRAHCLEPDSRIRKARRQGDGRNHIGVGLGYPIQRDLKGERGQMRADIEHLRGRAELTEQNWLNPD